MQSESDGVSFEGWGGGGGGVKGGLNPNPKPESVPIIWIRRLQISTR